MESTIQHPISPPEPTREAEERHDELPEYEIQEVRLAMALNGGVSLAVWMGGCAVELDCARRARWGPEDQAFDAVMGGNTAKGQDSHEPISERTVYSSLCDAFGRELVIDIMSGASAGGVNGGLLAGAMVSGRRLHPAYVRQQWLRLGDFSELLHNSTNPAPHSLLRGELFLDSLLEVFSELMGNEANAMRNGLVIPDAQAVPPVEPPPHLEVTVTDVRGTERTYRDKWDEIFSAREYRRRFSFRGQGDFTPENLAAAARGSASFPAAFEPFRAEPGPWGLTERSGLKPSGEGPPWTIDGGLLDNSPIRAAIDEVPARPAERQVKRYLVYVNPDPHEPLEPGAAAVGTNADGQTRSDDPELFDVAGYVVTLPRKLPFVDQLDAIEDAVERSSLLADGALPLLRAPIETLASMAESLLPVYARRRRLKSLRELLDDPAAAEQAFKTLGETCSELPWIPRSIELGTPARWEWGLSAALRICHFLVDLIRMRIAKERDREKLKLLLDARTRLNEPLAELQAALLGAEADQELTHELRSAEPKLGPRERVAGLQGLAGDQQSTALPAVRRALCIFADLVTALNFDFTLEDKREECDPKKADTVEVGAALLGERWQDDVAFKEVCKKSACECACKRVDGDLTRPERQALRRLLAIEVIRRAYTAEERVDSAQELNFVQLTPDAPTPIFSSNPIKAPFPASAESKLTGIRLGHFAGFLKRSWRANDFMWGRLDAAARIVDLLVDPARAEWLGRERVAGKLADALMGKKATLEQRWLVREALGKAAGGSPQRPPEPDQLRARLREALTEDLRTKDARLTRAVCTRAAQLEIVKSELPAIAKATREDAADGSATKQLHFGQVEKRTGELPTGVLRDAIANVRDGKPLPERLGRDDPAETTSDLTARMAARAGFVTLAALRTAKLPAAQALDLLRPPLLAVTGMSARGVWLRIPLVLGFWAAAIYLAARTLGTIGEADLDEVGFDEVLLALVAVLTVAGVAILPFVRGLRRRWKPVAFAEFATGLGILLVGGGAAIGLALAFGDQLTVPKLIVGNGFDAPPDAVLVVAILVALGLSLARAKPLERPLGWMLNHKWGGVVQAGLLTVVAIVVSRWTVPDLFDVIDDWDWRTAISLTALIGPPLICGVYLVCHSVTKGPRAGPQ